MNPDHLSVSVESDEACILYYNRSDLKPGAICHELLHLERFWLREVPKIYTPPLADFSGDLACGHGILDNALEHLTIVPGEIARGYSRLDYWHRTLSGFWERSPTWAEGDPRSARQNDLMGYTAVEALFPGTPVAALLPRKLSELGFGEPEIAQLRSVLAATGNKPLQVALAMAFIGFAPTQWGLSYLYLGSDDAHVDPGFALDAG